MGRPTLQDVAREARVSVATVSRVIRNEANVSSETVTEVRNAMKKLNYDAHRSKHRKLVGLIVPDITNPFFAIMLRGMERVARLNEYNIVVHDSHDVISQENESLQRLLDLYADGVVITPSNRSSELPERLIAEGYPMVLADRLLQSVDSVCSVSVDNADGAYQAAKYLVSLGHQEILHLAGPSESSTERGRYSGYRAALEEAGIEIAEDLAVSGNYHFDESYDLVRDAIARRLHFTAVFASNDVMALGAMKAIQDSNMSVPDDVSVCGYDDIPFSSMVKLTTISQPAYEMGRNAMIMLIDLIEGKLNPPSQIILKPSLVIRGTCKAVSR